MNNYILGISCFYHDSAAVLLKNNEIIAAVQEERISRKKFDNRFPINSINACLKIANINSLNEVKYISFYEDPNIKLGRIVKNKIIYKKNKLLDNIKSIKDWVNKKYFIEDYFKYYFPKYTGEILYFNHHLSHASSAFFPSQFNESAILIIDGVGESNTTSISHGKNNKVKMLKSLNYPNSLGFLYSAFTELLGFKVDSGEYKLMGLAPYGEPIYYNKIFENLINLNKDGSFKLNLNYFDFMQEKKMINKKFMDLFDIKKIRRDNQNLEISHMNIASSIQKVTEDILFKIIDYTFKITNSDNLCMAGGVVLNCVANGKIQKYYKNKNFWFQPASGDAGGALGASLLCSYHHLNFERNLNKEDSQKNSLLGPEYSNKEIKKTLDLYSFKYTKMNISLRAEKIANLLSKNNVVALFQGRMEFGPRALGNRSILGNPLEKTMQKKMNLKIKFRESFRPFAPIIKLDKLNEWFDLNIPSPYMMLVSNLKKEKELNANFKNKAKGFDKLNFINSPIPSVSHVDNSSRIQTVTLKTNSKLYLILDEFEKITKCPILINTSFNIRGEPIVASPYESLLCFMNTDIDFLIIEDYLLDKKEQKNILKNSTYKDSFELD